MYKNTKTLILIAGMTLAIIQTSFLSTLLPVSFQLNLVVAFCLAILFAQNMDLAYVFAFTVGIFLDLITTSPVGITPLLLCLIVLGYKWTYSFYLTGFVSKFVFATVVFYVFKLVLAKTILFNFEIFLLCVTSSLITFLVFYPITNKYVGQQKVNL